MTHDLLQVDQDSIEDFRDVFRFEETFDAGYRIEIRS